MALIITPGAATADSYVTVVEATAYLTDQALYTVDANWVALSTAAKEQRLRLGALMMESMSFRGVKSCRDQALSFPRWVSTDDGYPEYSGDPEYGYTYIDTSDITDAGYDIPDIPDGVKYTQIEMTYQIIHKIVSEAEPGDPIDRLINKVTVGSALAVEFGALSDSDSPAFSRSKLTAMSVMSLYMTKWLRRISGGVA